MLLDIDVLIDLERNVPAAVAWLTALTQPPFVSGFAALELADGCANKRELRRVRRLLAPFPLAWPDGVDMARAYEEYADLRLSHGIGLLDTLIASTAVGLGLAVATFNVKHFKAIPGLKTVQPYKR